MHNQEELKSPAISSEPTWGASILLPRERNTNTASPEELNSGPEKEVESKWIRLIWTITSNSFKKKKSSQHFKH